MFLILSRKHGHCSNECRRGVTTGMDVIIVNFTTVFVLENFFRHKIYKAPT